MQTTDAGQSAICMASGWLASFIRFLRVRGRCGVDPASLMATVEYSRRCHGRFCSVT